MKEKKGEERKKKQTISVAVNRYLSWWFRLLAKQETDCWSDQDTAEAINSARIGLYIAFCALLTSDDSAKSLLKTSISG